MCSQKHGGSCHCILFAKHWIHVHGWQTNPEITAEPTAASVTPRRASRATKHSSIDCAAGRCLWRRGREARRRSCARRHPAAGSCARQRSGCRAGPRPAAAAGPGAPSALQARPLMIVHEYSLPVLLPRTTRALLMQALNAADMLSCSCLNPINLVLRFKGMARQKTTSRPPCAASRRRPPVTALAKQRRSPRHRCSWRCWWTRSCKCAFIIANLCQATEWEYASADATCTVPGFVTFE